MKLINKFNESLYLPMSLFMGAKQMARELSSLAYSYRDGSVLSKHKRYQEKQITLTGSWWSADNPDQEIMDALAFMNGEELKLYEEDDYEKYWSGVELMDSSVEWLQRGVEAQVSFTFKIPYPFRVGDPQTVELTATAKDFSWIMPNDGQLAVSPYLIKITPQSGASFENPRITNTTDSIVSSSQINETIDDADVLTLNMQEFSADLNGSSIVSSFDDSALLNPLLVYPSNPELVWTYGAGSGTALIELGIIPVYF